MKDKLNVSDLAKFEFCPRQFYIGKHIWVQRDTIASICGKIEHEVRRLLWKPLKEEYSNLSCKSKVNKIKVNCFKKIVLALLHAEKVAKISYPTFSLQIETFMKELNYRLYQEEEERLQRAIELVRKGITTEEIIAKLFPWEVELNLSSEKLGLVGRIDQVFKENGELIPVDLKSMPFGFVFRSSNAVQIAAYSLLLEEKFNTNISLGKVFYTRSLVYDVIPITKTLRSKVLRIKNEIKKILTSENLPPPLKGLESIKCNYCVFKNECSNLQTNEKFSIQSIECANDINLGCEDVK